MSNRGITFPVCDHCLYPIFYRWHPEWQKDRPYWFHAHTGYGHCNSNPGGYLRGPSAWPLQTEE